MEYLLAEEAEIDRKLRDLEKKKEANAEINLRELKSPKDVSAISEERRQVAYNRNNEFLKALSTEVGKLHTKRLCPLQSKLEDLKTGFYCNLKRP